MSSRAVFVLLALAISVSTTARVVEQRASNKATATAPIGIRLSPITVASMSAAELLPDTGGLVASYPFSGNAEDASGNGHHGVVQGAVLTTDRFGEANRAYRFDGVGSSVEVAALAVPLAGAFTISYWEQSTRTTRMHALSVGQSSGTNLDFNFNDQTGGISYGLWTYWNGSGVNRVWTETVRGGGLTDGLWHHVVLRRSGVRIELFVDGTLQGGTDYAGTIAGPGPLRIGRGSYNTGWWQGQLDDVQVYSRALDNTEIATLSEDRPTLRVLSPNGGEVWQAGSPQDIRWVVDERVAAVKLEYSSDDGASWQTIVASTPTAAGHYSWTIPDVLSSRCRVRVSDVAGGGRSDVSDAVFVILRGTGGLVASYPFSGNAEDASGNGHHGVVQGAVLTTDRFGEANRAYRFDGVGSSVEVAALAVPLAGAFTISYWEQSTRTTRMHALSVGQSSGTNLDFNFNDQTGGISYGLWTYWNGSGVNRVWTETVRGGGLTDGLWHHVVLRRSGVRIELFVDGTLQGGTDYAGTIAGPGPLRIGRGSYNTGWWQGQLDDVQVYSRALDNTEIATLSEDRPTLRVLSPNGGEVWQAGSPQDIRWVVDERVAAVKLEYSSDDGASWQTIVASTPTAAGHYSWTIPDVLSSRCRVRVSDVAGGGRSDVSDAVFVILRGTGGLVAWYPFSGNAEDASGNGNHGVVQGAVLTTDRFGEANRAYRFDGVGSSVEVAALPVPLAGAFTISYWEQSTRTTRMHALSVGQSSGTNLDFNFNDQTGGISYGLWTYWNGSGGNRVWTEGVRGGGLTDGRWHHVVLRRSGVRVELFVDGSLQGGTDYPGTIAGPGPLRIGRGSYNTGWWQGLLDDVQIYSRALDNTEIATLSEDRPTLRVLSPNGGEVWQTGSTPDIRWVVDERVAAVQLEYSSDDGVTWQTIVASTPMVAGRYAWTVPDVRSSQGRVRVRAVGGGPSDVSDAVFEIDNRPTLRVLSPNGGEVWQTGSTPDIRWVVDERVAAVRLEYSGDDGASWQTIVASTPMVAGRYAWTVPDVRSSQCRVRISDVAGEGHSDVSDAVFVILRGTGGLVASYPFTGNAEDASGNGHHGVVQGAVLTTDRFGETNRAYRFDGVGSSVEVAALAVPLAGAFTISYWEQSTRTTRMHALSVGQSSGTNLDFNFNDQTGGITYGLWAYWNGLGSNRIWTEGVRGGGFTDGRWHHVVLRRSGVRVELFVDGSLQGGTDYPGTIAGPGPLRIGRGSYNTEWWQGLLDDVQIYSRALDNTEIATLSEDRPTLRVLSPNGGEVWQTGSTPDIRWVVDERVAAVQLEYSSDDGVTWQTIVASTPMVAGRYTWTVPDVRSSQGRVRVRAVGGGPSDVSDAVFEIDNRPTLRVLSPNGGEVWQTGSTPDIRWVVDERVAAVRLEYSGDDGVTWQAIVASTPMVAGRYAWTVPDVRSSQGRVRISDVAGEGHSDVSDAVFEIDNRPTLRVLSPNGGEVWQTGSTPDIRWVVDERVAAVRLEYSSDDGASWQTIVASTPMVAGRYAWTVPDVRSSQGRVRISDVAGEGHSDVSDAVFEIDNRPTRVLSPNGGEVWQTGSTQDIRWVVDERAAAVQLEYSSDDGASWQTIVASTPMVAGRYAWTVPDVRSSQCRVRVSDVAGEGHSDVSDAVFVILRGTGGLVASYPFTGNAEDASGNGHHGVVYSATLAADRFGAPASAYFFNGGSAHIEVPTLPIMLSSNFTISYWEQSTRTTRMHALSVGQSSGTNLDFNFNDQDGDISYGLWAYWNGSGGNGVWTEAVQGGGFTDGRWHHVVLRRSGVRVELFVDGSLQGGTDYPGTIAGPGPLRIGRGSYNTGWWQGLLDDVQIYSRALDNTEIATLSSDRASIVIWSPVGGESWQAGSTHDITWNADAGVSALRLEYSSDNGGTWQTIVDSTPAAAGHFTWVVPDLSSARCLVRLSDAAGVEASVHSPATFWIFTAAEQWRLVTPHAAFEPRDGAGALVFNGYMWLLGGYSFPTNEYGSEIWRSADGANWQLVARAPWPPRHAAGYVVYDNKMWVISGDGYADAWYSSDGITWTLATDAAPWGRRYKPYVVAYDDKIWLMGGIDYYDGHYIGYNDVWNTTDGIQWTRVTEHAAWLPRGPIHGPVVFNGKMWLLGGGLYGPVPSGHPEVYYNDVWNSVNGIDWQLVTANAPWLPRLHHSAFVYADRLWVLAGHDFDLYGTGPKNDVWMSPDGANWQQLPESPWSPRHATSVFVFNDDLWLAAGFADALVNDVWTLQRAGNITIANGAAFTESSLVTLTLSAPDLAVDEMQLSDDGVNWSASTSYSTQLEWTLSPGDGIKTVYVRFRGAPGAWSDTYQDTIEYSSAPYLRLTAPAGGESWQTTNAVDITWAVGTRIANLKLEYSLDAGATWTEIVSSTAAAAGRYSWTVPDLPSSRALVRVSDAADASVASQSLESFTIFRAIDGLVASYPFDGDARDLSGNDNHGTVYAATLAVDRFGQSDKAFEFDGTGAYIEIGRLATSLAGDFTISFWEMSHQSRRMDALSLSDNALNNLDFDFNEGPYSLMACWNGSGTRAVTQALSNGSLTDGVWHHIALRRTGYEIELLVDGTSRGVTTYWGPVGSRVPLRIGRGSSEPNWWSGFIDDVRIYNRALSNAELNVPE